MDTEYVDKKVLKCQGLVDNATSDEQKKLYQGYLDFWTKKLPKAQRPEIITKKEEAKAEKILEENAELARLEMIAMEKAKVEAEELAEAKALKIAELEAKHRAELAALDEPEPEPEELNEINFELLYPNKKAYRTQNGERIETIAYKEYLNKTESE